MNTNKETLPAPREVKEAPTPTGRIGGHGETLGRLQILWGALESHGNILRDIAIYMDGILLHAEEYPLTKEIVANLEVARGALLDAVGYIEYAQKIIDCEIRKIILATKRVEP